VWESLKTTFPSCSIAFTVCHKIGPGSVAAPAWAFPSRTGSSPAIAAILKFRALPDPDPHSRFDCRSPDAPRVHRFFRFATGINYTVDSHMMES
jgi:hypothetical protein